MITTAIIIITQITIVKTTTAIIITIDLCERPSGWLGVAIVNILVFVDVVVVITIFNVYCY